MFDLILLDGRYRLGHTFEKVHTCFSKAVNKIFIKPLGTTDDLTFHFITKIHPFPWEASIVYKKNEPTLVTAIFRYF